MFPSLPSEVEYIIWKFYFSDNVLKEIYSTHSVWENASNRLFLLTNDSGCVQQNHTDLIRLIDEYIPHSSFLNWVIQDELKERPYIQCEDCLWGWGRCQYEDLEDELADRMINFWHASLFNKY